MTRADSISLSISILALVTSVGTGVYTWRRSGEVLTVRGDLRAPLFQSANRRRVRAAPITLGGLTVVAANRGRAEAEIHRLWLVDATGARTSCQLAERSAPLPTMVKARNRVTWRIDAGTLGVISKARGNPLVLRPVIEAGPGVIVRGRKMWIAVPDEFLPGHGQHFTPTLVYRVRTWRKGIKDLERRVRAGAIGQITFEARPGTITVSDPPPAEVPPTQ